MDQKGQLKKNDKLLAVEQEGGSQKEGDGADYEKDENHQQNWNCHLQKLQ